MRDPTQAQRALRLLGWILLVLLVLFGAELVADLWRTGTSFAELELTPSHMQALASTVSRAFNNLTTMVLAFIAVAVPITANLYTPRLIEIFVGDRVNLLVLVFFAMMGAHGIFVQATAFAQWAPSVQFTVAWTSAALGFAGLIPYFLYVLRFLDPDRIIELVRGRVTAEYGPIAKGARPVPAAQRRLDARILHLGNVILRAVGRSDRDVSLSAIEALRHGVEEYLVAKRTMPPAWFDVTPGLFTGLSDEVVELIGKERTWVEHKCLRQLLLTYNAALTAMPDAISAISDVNRRIALRAWACGDDGALRLCVRFFNTYLRAAVRRRDVHAIYDVFHQYKRLAQDLLDAHPAAATAIVRHVRYYAEFARLEGVPFVYELGASDMGALAAWAHACGSPARRPVLEEFLGLDAPDASVRMTTVRAILAGALRDAGFAEEAALVADRLYGTEVAQLERARANVERTTDITFWEVTDRQRNLDYLEPERRATVVAVLTEAIERKRPR
jgi:hypothetical protein